jgi:DNA-binding CsgD family transcriptional regulator
LRRHSANLCHLIYERFESIISDYEDDGLPKEHEFAYEILTDAFAAYAFTSSLRKAEDVNRRLKEIRASFSSRDMYFAQEALAVEVISMCALGQWTRARRLSELMTEFTLAFSALKQAVVMTCAGPPFIGVVEIVEECIGKPYVGLPALLLKRIISRDEVRLPELAFTVAEREVLRLLGLGRSNKEIATERGRSVETVKRQVTSVYKKLGVESRITAVAVARRRGLL